MKQPEAGCLHNYHNQELLPCRQHTSGQYLIGERPISYPQTRPKGHRYQYNIDQQHTPARQITGIGYVGKNVRITDFVLFAYHVYLYFINSRMYFPV